jgi:5,10-methylenetetrahydrofolate reductase
MDLRKKLDGGQFVTLVEFIPPKGTDLSAMIGIAEQIRDGVDAFLVPDQTGSVMRMSALGAAAALQSRGLATIMETGCRNRNRIALQADLLAAGALDIAGVLATPGEDIGGGDHPEAKTVDDVDVLGLLEMIGCLQGGKDMAGRPLLGSPSFCVGATVGAAASAAAEGGELDAEVQRMRRQADLGATYFVTPPLFDVVSMEPFLKALGTSGARIIPTVLLLKSLGMARYISAHHDLVQIPQSLIERIEDAEDVPRELMRIATETIAAVQQAGFGGVLVSTAGWERRLPEILGMQVEIDVRRN